MPRTEIPNEQDLPGHEKKTGKNNLPVETSHVEEKEENPEQILENLAETLKGISELEQAIEDNGEAAIAQSGDPKVIAEHKAILEELQTEKIGFLKKISQKLSAFGEGIAASFRDKRVAKESKKLHSDLSNSKIINKYGQIRYADDRSGLEEAKKKAQAFLEKKLESSIPLFSTIKSSDWGKSKHGDDAVRSANDMLNRISMHARELSFDQALFQVVDIYEQSETVRASGSSKFCEIVPEAARYLKDKNSISYASTTDELEAACKGDPFLICENLDRSSYVGGEDTTFFEKQIDTLIERYPRGGKFPATTSKLFATALNLNPEKYGLDSKNRQAMFDVLRQYTNYGKLSELPSNTCFFTEELKSLSSEEVTKVVKNCLGDFGDRDIQNLLSMLPLEDAHFQIIHEHVQGGKKDVKNSKSFSSDELFKDLQDKYDFRALSIPFFQWQKFNLDADTRTRIFANLVSDANGRSECFQVLMNVLSNFQNVFKDLPSEEWEESLHTLIDKGTRDGLEPAHIFALFSPKYDVPDKYKDKIRQFFVQRYESGNASKHLFGKQNEGESVVLDPHETWLSTQPDLVAQLERTFYKKGSVNDLRHFFYQVMEGQREAAHKDELIKAYAERVNNITPEEFIDLFIVGKKVDMSFAGLFLNNVKNVWDITDQMEELVRLEKISEKEYNDFLTEGAKIGPAQFADFCFNSAIDKNIVPAEEREQFMTKYTDNLFQSVANDTDLQSSKVFAWMKEKNQNEKITPEEKTLLLQEYFKGYIATPKLHSNIEHILRQAPAFSDIAYPDPEQRKEFVAQVLALEDPYLIAGILDMYGFNGKSQESRNDDPFLSLVSDEQANALFSKGLSLNNLSVDFVVGDLLGQLSREQQMQFRDSFLSRDDVFASESNDIKMQHLCIKLSNYFLSEQSFARKDQAVFSVEDSQKMFSKIFASTKIESLLPVFVSPDQRNLIPMHDPVIFKGLISTLERVGKSDVLYTALKNFTDPQDPRLSTEEVTTFSKKMLEKSVLTGEMYRMYLESTPEKPRLILDQDMLNTVVERMSNPAHGTSIVVGSTVDLLLEQRRVHGKEGIVTLTDAQEAALVGTLLTKTLKDNDIANLQRFDQGILDASVIQSIETKKINTLTLHELLRKAPELSPLTIDKIIPYVILVNQTEGCITALLNYAETNEQRMSEIKNYIDKDASIEMRGALKGKLLERDLLQSDEIKSFYEDIRGQKDVRSGVLLCAEMLGSLVSSSNPEAMKAFLSNQEDAVALKQIEQVASFVKKNPTENKGRTIAVMLFAKEFLPELSAEEVISRAANKLAKYERVLDQYSYKGVPEGLRVSLGTELELTHSTSAGYEELTGRDLKQDIVRLSKAAHIGEGNDAVHEVATRPALNPYLLVLELQLLQNLEYMDLNFDRSELYATGSHSFHMTIGGERGLTVNANTQFLQNAIVAAGWGGLLAGARGKSVSAARGVALRGRSPDDSHNVKMFDTPTSSVEMRSISPDKMEPTQRAIITSYHGGVAIQALEKYTNLPSDKLADLFAKHNPKSSRELIEHIETNSLLKENNPSEKVSEILFAWGELLDAVRQATEYHNEDFLTGETIGHLNEDGVWVEREEFGGEYNRSMFEGVVTTIDPTLSVEEYVESTKIKYLNFFTGMDTKFSDILTNINNLYLKPDVRKERKKDEKEKGDRTNALSMLETTKLPGGQLESRTEDAYLQGTVFETLGERREGYYALQGGSERMITHAVQRALLSFNKKMEELLK